MRTIEEQQRRLERLQRAREWMECIAIVADAVMQGKSDEEMDAFCVALHELVKRGQLLEQSDDSA